MIILSTIQNLYLISYFPHQPVAPCLYLFHKDFLPRRSLRHIRSLSIFNDARNSVYMLDDDQDSHVMQIFRKMYDEKGSGYAFSDHLQRIYLQELIHTITKIHQLGGVAR